MKHIIKIFALILFFSISVNAQEGWISQTSGTSNALGSVYFFDSDTGWTVGGSGTILKTTNGGVTWDSLSSGTTTKYLCSVFFVNADTGYAVGGSWGAIILKTTDGGKNWFIPWEHPWRPSKDLASVYFINADTGWVSGGWGVIHKTNDGGKTWKNQLVQGFNYSTESIYFTNANTGWAVGGFPWKPIEEGRIFKTSDGESWFIQSSGIPNFLKSVYFINDTTGWVVGNSGIILRTTDGGVTWDSLSSGTSNDLNSVHFFDSDTGWTAGDSGTILKTIDGGTIWYFQESGTSNNLNSVYFIDAKIGWIVGNSGTILKTMNGGNRLTGEISYSNSYFPNHTSLMQNYPNPFNIHTTISFKLPRPTEVLVNIFNIEGKLVVKLTKGIKKAGHHSFTWDASNFSTGMYFIKMQTNDFVETKKCVLLR